MEKYYVVEESYKIENHYECFSIMDKAVFKTIEDAKDYIASSLKDKKHRIGEWEFDEYNKSNFCKVEFYEPIHETSDIFTWADYSFYITELTLR